MRLWITLFLLLSIPNLSKVRQHYTKATSSEAASVAFYDLLSDVAKNDDVRLVAYKGAGFTLISRFKESAKEKTTTFKKGTELIDWAVTQAPNNVEVRFVRLTVQQHAPRFLHYHEQILSDKKFIFSQLGLMKQNALKAYITDYILKSDKFSVEEKARFAE